jgi:hypothetical protein
MTCQMRDCHQSRHCPAPAACGLVPAPMLRPVRAARQPQPEPRRSYYDRSIGPVVDLILLAWWKWAAREINPTHADVPKIIRRIAELERRAL